MAQVLNAFLGQRSGALGLLSHPFGNREVRFERGPVLPRKAQEGLRVARRFRLVQPRAELSLQVGHLIKETFGAQGILMPLGEGQKHLTRTSALDLSVETLVRKP